MMNLVDFDPKIAYDYDVLFVDTEFSRLPLPSELLADWSRRVEIISVGIVAAEQSISPCELYAVRQLTSALKSKCSEFVKEQVLPLIGLAELGDPFRNLQELSMIVADFLKQRFLYSKKPALIAVDWSGDLQLLASVLPQKMKGVSLENIIDIDSKQLVSGALRHHALHDARQLRRVFLGEG